MVDGFDISSDGNGLDLGDGDCAAVGPNTEIRECAAIGALGVGISDLGG